MTIEAIAQWAEVSAQSVYAIFKSKTGILIALLDQSMFGPDYEEVVQQALSVSDPETRLRRAASVGRQIRSAQSAAFDLLRGAGVVAPELAKLERQRERLRYEKEESMTRPRGISSGCLLVGMCTGCWCASVGGHLRNTKIGWPTLWCFPC